MILIFLLLLMLMLIVLYSLYITNQKGVDTPIEIDQRLIASINEDSFSVVMSKKKVMWLCLDP